MALLLEAVLELFVAHRAIAVPIHFSKEPGMDLRQRPGWQNGSV